MPGSLVISLDFELHWGVRDHIPLQAYQERLIGARRVVLQILDTFSTFNIHATWAAVGFLFFSDKQTLLEAIPEVRPIYKNAAMDPYRVLEKEVGQDEYADPYHFAPSLIKKIVVTPGQRIGSHTFSHYYCLEKGQTPEAFKADLIAAKCIAKRFGIALESVVFPRNQVHPSYVEVCTQLGFRSYRGNPSGYGHGSIASSYNRRLFRLADAYLPLSRHNCIPWSSIVCDPIANVRASRFMRPYSRHMRFFEPIRLLRIRREMLYAARCGHIYHLWWHPHNFGINFKENLIFLQNIIRYFQILKSKYGMESLNMEEVCERMTSLQGKP